MAKQKFSMRPEMGEEGGLPLANADVRIVEAEYTTWSEAGEQALVGNREAEDPCAKIVFEFLNPQDGDKPVEQFLSAGKGTRFSPSEDGEEPSESGPFIVPVEGVKARGLNKNTRIWQFLNSLVTPPSGKLKFDSRKLDDEGLASLVGLEAHVMRVPAPVMQGVAREEGAREQTMLIAHEILALPGKGAGKRKAKDDDEADERPAKKGKAKDEDEDDGEGDGGGDPISEEAEAIIVKALDKAGDDGIKKSELVKVTFNATTKSKNSKKIIALYKDEDWVGDDERPWNYDSDEEVLTAAAS